MPGNALYNDPVFNKYIYIYYTHQFSWVNQSTEQLRHYSCPKNPNSCGWAKQTLHQGHDTKQYIESAQLILCHPKEWMLKLTCSEIDNKCRGIFPFLSTYFNGKDLPKQAVKARLQTLGVNK